jgi:hypothetical protein
METLAIHIHLGHLGMHFFVINAEKLAILAGPISTFSTSKVAKTGLSQPQHTTQHTTNKMSCCHPTLHLLEPSKTGYIRNEPLPRLAPRIQSASHVMSHGAEPNTCYLQVPRVPTCSDPNRLLKGLGGNGPCLFSPVG